MVRINEIRPLTEFLRNHKQRIRGLKRSGRPEVLTINGRAEVVIQDAAAYQSLLDMLDSREANEGIRRGLESMRRKRGRPAEQVFASLRRKLKIPE